MSCGITNLLMYYFFFFLQILVYVYIFYVFIDQLEDPVVQTPETFKQDFGQLGSFNSRPIHKPTIKSKTWIKKKKQVFYELTLFQNCVVFILINVCF